MAAAEMAAADNDQPDFYNSVSPRKNIARIFTMFLLLVVLMTFGGLIGAYIVLATNGALEWRPFDLPVQVWISTAIILTSSFTYHVSKKLLFKNEQEKSKKWLSGDDGSRCGVYFLANSRVVYALPQRRLLGE